MKGASLYGDLDSIGQFYYTAKSRMKNSRKVRIMKTRNKNIENRYKFYMCGEIFSNNIFYEISCKFMAKLSYNY
jgi:hypothetical protein